MWTEFILRSITRLLWPLVPIGMELALRFYVTDSLVFPNQSILVLAFIIPAAYITDFKGDVSVHLISILSLVGTVPFMSSVVVNKPIVYWSGFYLYAFYLALFLLIDAVTTYQKVKEVAE